MREKSIEMSFLRKISWSRISVRIYLKKWSEILLMKLKIDLNNYNERKSFFRSIFQNLEEK